MRGLLVSVVTTLVCLLAAETMMRWLDGYAVFASELRAARVATGISEDAQRSAAARHLGALPLAPGVQRDWFFEDPAPPARLAQPVSPERAQRFADYAARGLDASQSLYVWNRAFVTDNRAAEWAATIGRLPLQLDTFAPVGGSERPVYRFPPAEHLPNGMVTNRHGFRGDDFRFAGDARQVVVAFVGASTTQEDYSFRHSFPERVGHWLNRWAEATNLPLRFDIINAGREGLGSRDIAAIVEQEIAPLRPDFVVYLEGSNQTQSYRALVRRPVGGLIPPYTPAPTPGFSAWARRSAVLNRVAQLFPGRGLIEPPKPAYELMRERLRLEGVQRGDYRDLPLSLDVICGDLQRIRNSALAGGGELLLSTFTWFDPRGQMLDGQRHRQIHEQLNARSWPLTNADWHELMSFQNAVFRTFAAAEKIGLIDADRAMPKDADLFADPIHVTPSGSRVRGWIMFNELVPHIQRAWANGRLQRNAPVRREFNYGPILQTERPRDPAPPLVDPATLVPHDRDVLHLQRFEVLDAAAHVATTGTALHVTTGPAQWQRAAGLTFVSPTEVTGAGRLVIELKVRVLAGAVGFGFLRFDHSDTLHRQVVSSAENDTLVSFLLEPDEIVSHLVIENAVAGTASQVLIESVMWRML